MEEKDKIIILTGGSRGIGHATSKKIWDDGWTVITFSRSEVAPKCPWSNNKQFHFQVDLEDEISLNKKLRELSEFLNGRPVKALINNAAISPGAIAFTLILSLARSDAISLVSDFRAALDVA